MKPISRLSVYPIWLLTLILGFSACDEDRIQFSEPQPAGISADSKLRNDFLGTYYDKEDSIWLVISADRVFAHKDNISLQINGTNAESGGDGNADIQITSDSSRMMKLKIRTDAKAEKVSVDGTYEEEYFSLKHGDEARYRKGYYFLNRLIEGEGFLVRFLKKTETGVVLCRIQSDSVLQLLESEPYVHKLEGHSWKLNPTRNQLKKLINQGLFSDLRYFDKHVEAAEYE